MRQCPDLGLLSSDDLLGDTEFQPDTEMLDARLSEATMAAVSNFSVTPLIKEELRVCIQTKRLAKGEDAIELDTRTPEPDELTPADLERRDQRRDRNKEAAQKCRVKKRQRCDSLTIEEKLLEKKFAKLSEDVKKLTKEKESLEQYIHAHKQFCSLAFLSETDMEQTRDHVTSGGESCSGEGIAGDGVSFVGEEEGFARDDVLLIEDDPIADGNLLICEDDTSLVEEIISFGDDIVIDDSLLIYGSENIAGFSREVIPSVGSETIAGLDSEAIAAFSNETIAGFGSETIAGFGSETIVCIGNETIGGFGSEIFANFGSETIAGCSHETTG